MKAHFQYLHKQKFLNNDVISKVMMKKKIIYYSQTESIKETCQNWSRDREKCEKSTLMRGYHFE